MKKIITLTLFLISIIRPEPIIVNENMIYGSMIDTIKRIPDSIANIGNYTYKTEIKKEKNFWWYWHRNQAIKKRLKERKIDYYTILKQGMYPRKVYDNSREAEIKKYAILVSLAKTNDIDISDIIGKTEKKQKNKKKINIIMSDK